jgi:hypothetical protein
MIPLVWLFKKQMAVTMRWGRICDPFTAHAWGTLCSMHRNNTRTERERIWVSEMGGQDIGMKDDLRKMSRIRCLLNPLCSNVCM